MFRASTFQSSRFASIGNKRIEKRRREFAQHVENRRLDILALKNLPAQAVNGGPLLVHDIVIFEQMFTNIEVVPLHLALGAFDRARNHARRNRFVLGDIQSIHDFLNPLTVENAHQVVFE